MHVGMAKKARLAQVAFEVADYVRLDVTVGRCELHLALNSVKPKEVVSITLLPSVGPKRRPLPRGLTSTGFVERCTQLFSRLLCNAHRCKESYVSTIASSSSGTTTRACCMCPRLSYSPKEEPCLIEIAGVEECLLL